MKKLNKKLGKKSFSVEQYACGGYCLCFSTGTPEMTGEEQKKYNTKALADFTRWN